MAEEITPQTKNGSENCWKKSEIEKMR